MKVLAQAPYTEVIGTKIINETEEEFTLFSKFKLKGHYHDGFLYIEVFGERSESFFTIGTVGFERKPPSSLLKAKVIIINGNSEFDLFVGIEIEQEDAKERKVLIVPDEEIFRIENYKKELPKLEVRELSKWKIRKWRLQAFIKKIRKKLRL